MSSEGDVSLYDFDKTKAADLQITNNRMRLSSRETVTHHKKFEKINDDQLQKLLLSVKTFIPEEGYEKSIIEPYHHEDEENLSNKSNMLKPHEIASMTLTNKQPITDINPNTNILIYKKGVADETEYSGFP